VVPSLKLIFCFIPKNACTQFNRLMNALNGIDLMWDGDICSKRDPNYKSTMYNNFTATDLESALNDPTWTKATFLREPLQRLVSAYLSKCVEPRECGGCEGLEFSGSPKPEVAELASVLPYSRDAHFLPQSELCGGLGQNIGAYDYVGHIEDDASSVSDQVAEMLELAVHRQQISSADTAASHSDLDGSDAAKSELTGDALASAPLQHGSLSPFGRSLSAREAHVLELGRKFFPLSGPDQNDPHVHPDRNASELLHDMFSLKNVLSAYEEDYNTLPGLERPKWAHRVSQYYELFPIYGPKPQWLDAKV
jgi:hypothetical protein